jgi:hypothetical protein
MTVQHYGNDKADWQTVRTWLRNTETSFYVGGTFKLMQRWQKCLKQSSDFVEY